jgi:hypothetical protein
VSKIGSGCALRTAVGVASGDIDPAPGFPVEGSDGSAPEQAVRANVARATPMSDAMTFMFGSSEEVDPADAERVKVIG